MSGAKETAQGKALVDAAKAAGVQHFVFSYALRTFCLTAYAYSRKFK